MEPLLISISGAPRGQGRPRTVVRGGFATIYKADPDRKYEKVIRIEATKFMAGRKPLEGPLSVSLRFRMPIPKSATKAAHASMAAGETPCTSKPDVSNLAKAIEDALNAVVYLDDSQIVRLFTTKVYAEKPGIDIRVESLTGN